MTEIFNEDGKLYLGAGSILDKYFHTIINPQKYGPKKFSRLFNYYWSCYFSIVEPILVSVGQESLINNDSNERDYKEYLKNINTINEDYLKKIHEEPLVDYFGTYYGILKEYSDDKDIDIVGILTTNYCSFAEKVSKNVAYLNGKIDLFEFPNKLTVTDDVDEYKNELFFPFIFGQSFLKPIVDHKQIEQFDKAKKILNGTDVLVILGYNINEDDNHINSYLTSFLNSGKRIIYVTDTVDEIKEKLRTDKEILYCNVNYQEEGNKEIIDKVIKQVNEIKDRVV